MRERGFRSNNSSRRTPIENQFEPDRKTKMKNWALVPLAALGAGHLANGANVNRAIENELFPHLKTCGVSTGSHGKIKEELTLRLAIHSFFFYKFWP